MNDVERIPPRSGTAFRVPAGATLTVIDPEGTQVADLLAFSADDVDEVVSSGRTLDYAERIRLTTGNVLFSNRSWKMLTIIEDTVGCHDFLLTPCSTYVSNGGKRFGGSFGICHGEGFAVRGAPEFAVIALCSNRCLYRSQTVWA